MTNSPWRGVDRNETHVLWEHENGGQCALRGNREPGNIATGAADICRGWRRRLGRRGYVDLKTGIEFDNYIPRDEPPAAVEPAAEPAPPLTRAERYRLTGEDPYGKDRNGNDIRPDKAQRYVTDNSAENRDARARLHAALAAEKPPVRVVAFPKDARNPR